jgi:hypothetical protein
MMLPGTLSSMEMLRCSPPARGRPRERHIALGSARSRACSCPARFAWPRTPVCVYPCPSAPCRSHVQGTVGAPVAYFRLSRWRTTTLPEEASMGDTPQRLAKEASLLNLSGLSPATINSVAAWSVPTAGRASNSGAARATSRSSWTSNSAISSERA